MTDKELRELDAWIAEHVMGLVWVVFSGANGGRWCSLCSKGVPWIERLGGKVVDSRPSNAEFDGDVQLYHANPSDAMAVLKKCLERDSIALWHSESDGIYKVESDRASATAETLELAICLFAKELFSK